MVTPWTVLCIFIHFMSSFTDSILKISLIKELINVIKIENPLLEFLVELQSSKGGANKDE